MNKKIISILIIFSLFVVSGCERYVGGLRNVDVEKDNLNNQVLDKSLLNEINSFDEDIYSQPEKISNSVNKDLELFESQFKYPESFVKVVSSENGDVEYFYPEPNSDVTDELDEIIEPPRTYRNYFDINIDVDEENEWVERSKVYIYIYYNGVERPYITTYNFMENNRIYLPDYINRNNNFDVILDIEMLRNGYVRRIIMIEPLEDNEDSVTFNLSNAEIVNTDFDDLKHEKSTVTSIECLGFEDGINNIKIGGFCRIGFTITGIENKIYVSGDTFNFYLFHLIDASYTRDIEDNINHLLLGTYLTYPLDDYYHVEDNLKQITFNIQNSFRNYFNRVQFNDNNFPSSLLPIRLNLYFVEEGSGWDSQSLLYVPGDDDFISYYDCIVGYIYFEDYYSEHPNEEITLNIIDKPNMLKLFAFPFSGNPLMGYVNGHNILRNTYELSNFVGIVFPQRLSEGYVRITTPNENTYSSLQNGGRFYVMCDGVGSLPYWDLFFPNMECVEGDYTIEWGFENIIRGRNLYLDAVVHFDGEGWDIIDENLRIVNLNEVNDWDARE